MALSTLAGCDSTPPPLPVPPSWQSIAAGNAFTFRAPTDLQPVPTQGIDSFVGRYKSPTLEVSFDYGWYSNRLEDDGYVGSWITVGGKRARLATRTGVVAIHFPKVEGSNRLTVRVDLHGGDPAVAHTLLRSITFP